MPLNYPLNPSFFKKDNVQKFDGTAYHFWSWVEQIKTVLQKYPQPVSPVTVLSVLQSNCSDGPNSTIKNFLAAAGSPTNDLVNEVWNLLIERYGSSDTIAEQLMSKLKKFPNISERAAGEKLREFHDLCSIAKFNQSNCSDLSHLNSRSGLQFLKEKLPPKLQSEWLDESFKYQQSQSVHRVDHPPFSVFVQFLRESTRKYAHGGIEYGPTLNSSDKKLNRVMATQKITASESEADITSKCPLHSSSRHGLLECKAFLNMPNDAKRSKLKDWHRCTRCVGNHNRNECDTSDIKCDVCSLKHHTIFHIKNFKPRNRDFEQNSRPQFYSNNNTNSVRESISDSAGEHNVVCTRVCRGGIAKNCSKTVPILLRNAKNNSLTLKTYAIIDDQSTCTLVDPKVPALLGCDTMEQEYSVNTVGGCETITSGHIAKGLVARGINKTEWISLPDAYTNTHIPNTLCEVATKDLVLAHRGIKKFANEFTPEIEQEAEVLILIGRDCGKAMQNSCHGVNEPWVFDTPLGFALVGNACTSRANHTLVNQSNTVLKTAVSHEHYNIKPIFSKNLSSDCIFGEFLDDEDQGYSINDLKFLNILSNEVSLCSSGHIEAPLPLTDSAPLPINEAAVYCRTSNTLNRLRKNPEAMGECLSSMEKSLAAGYVEEVPASELQGPQGACWYSPVFAVHHPKKKKVRIVHDSSAKFKGICLNQKLLTGPDLNNDLRSVLHRFREEKVAFVGDIEQMFNNFKVPKHHQDLLRFFWFQDNCPDKDLVPFRSTGHQFGCSSSPGVATFCLKFSTSLPSAKCCDKGAQYIRESFYMDDGLLSVATAEEAIQTIGEATHILKACNIRLHKFLSNSREVLSSLPPSEVAGGCLSLDFQHDQIPSSSTLGVYWDPEKDVFKIQVSIPDRPFTKRGVLATVNSLFDPLSLICPVTLAGKLIQREVLPKKENETKELAACGWDDELPHKYKNKWENWKSQLPELALIEIPRCLIPKHFIDPTREIHTFSDASEQGIGFCIYIKSICDGEIHVSLLSGGARVAPKAAVTIPRLELNAGLNAVYATAKVVSGLAFQPTTVTYYTDSQVLLGYLNNNDKPYRKYVGRRIYQILKLSSCEQWQYVNTSCNPADIASRSATAEELVASNWFSGPKFLWDKESPEPMPALPTDLPEQVSEVKVLVCSSSKKQEPSIAHVLADRNSSWLKIINVMKNLLKIRNKIDMIRQKLGFSLAPRCPEISHDEAITALVLIVQREAFCPLIDLLLNGKALPEREKITELSPFIDGNSVLRVGGRLSNSTLHFDAKHPILVPQDHPLTARLVEHHHSRVAHQGRVLTHAEVRRNGYHINGGKRYISKLISLCYICRKLRAAPETQLMADLPPDRLAEVPCFENTAMDVFGHFHIYERKATRSNTGARKIWVLILVCLASRAVHVEILPGMDTSSFRNAFQRFMSIRGTPKVIRSDHGSNFVASHAQMKESIDINDVQCHLKKRGITWIFNPPFCSHFGGNYERKIRSLRSCLEGCMESLGTRRLTFDEFSTLLQMSCGICNETPMAEISSSPDDPLPITPAALLTLKESADHPSLDEYSSEDLLAYGTKRWRRVQFLAQEFWSRWQRDYVSELSRRHKWKLRKDCISVGDVVLIREKSKRSCWPLAKVIKVKRSSDELVRSVSLILPPLSGSSKKRVVERAIHNLVLLVKSPNHGQACVMPQ